MANNADKTPVPGAIASRIFREQREQDERQPKPLPVKITGFGKNKTTVMVSFLTDQTYTLPSDVEIPINGTRYMRYPWQIGDLGYVLPSSVDTGPGAPGFSNSSQASFTAVANLASMAFHPLGNQNFDPPDDPDAVQHNGPTGTINRPDNKKSQQKTSDDGTSKSQGGGDGQGNFPHASTSGPDQVQHQSTSKVQTSAPTHEVTQDQTVGGNHMVANSIMAGNSVSAPSGSFAGGSIGGLPFGGAAGSFVQSMTAALNSAESSGAGGGLTEGSLSQTAGSNNVGAYLVTQPSYANDAAAKAGGVAVGQLYRNGSQVMVRVT